MGKISSGLLALFFIFQTQALAESVFEQGMKSYEAGDYKLALEAFYQAVRDEPGKQLYHYCLANCLVHLQEHAKAAEEYKVAYRLDPSSSTGEYSRQALLAYKETGARSKGPAKGFEKAKSKIEKETSFEKDKLQVSASSKQRLIQLQLETELKRIDSETQAEISKLYEVPDGWHTERRRISLSAAELSEREAIIRKGSQLRKENARRDAEERMKPLELQNKGRERLLDETALNLKLQLAQPAGASGVKLQSEGTGLYVRYYGKGGVSKYPDARPATAIIKEFGAAPEAVQENRDLSLSWKDCIEKYSHCR